MSIEIWQFPRKCNKDQLVGVLRDLGYARAENLFWPGPAGTTSLFWSAPRDYKSTSGVDASVFPIDDAARRAWRTEAEWALRTRTSAWASTFDQTHQNLTVRTVRARLGGTFFNDRFGQNRYIKVVPQPSTPASRGVYAVLTRLRGELDKLGHVLPEEQVKVLATPSGEISDGVGDQRLLAFTKRFDPSRVVYNALVPFLVAVVEHFFRESFEILVKYDSRALQKLEAQNRKVTFEEAAAIARGDSTLEQIASSWYSFQSIDSTHKAFFEILNIDIWKLLRRRKKVRTRLPRLVDALENLIGARHGVVHHFALDQALDREGFLDLLHLVQAILAIAAKDIERKLGVELGPG